MTDSTQPTDTDDVEALKAQIADLTASNLRAEVARNKGIPADLLKGVGDTEEELNAYADAAIAYFRRDTRTGPIAPNEGKNPGRPQKSAEHRFVQQLFNPDYPNA